MKLKKKDLYLKNLLDDHFEDEDENDNILWYDNQNQNINTVKFFNCGCCNKCSCNINKLCSNCNCGCNRNIYDDDYDIESDDSDESETKSNDSTDSDDTDETDETDETDDSAETYDSPESNTKIDNIKIDNIKIDNIKIDNIKKYSKKEVKITLKFNVIINKKKELFWSDSKISKSTYLKLLDELEK